jgi:hypothetical protein
MLSVVFVTRSLLNTSAVDFSTNLSRPANTLYRHNLTATLETAIRQSSAQHDPPDVLRRLDARMDDYHHGEIGWDVFMLEYKVDAPIDTVIDADTMIKYLKLFKHLWQIKRIGSTLNKGWMRVAGGARTFLRVPGKDVCPCRASSADPIRDRVESRMAPYSYRHGRDDTFHPPDGGILSARSYRMFVEDFAGVCQ